MVPTEIKDEIQLAIKAMQQAATIGDANHTKEVEAKLADLIDQHLKAQKREELLEAARTMATAPQAAYAPVCKYGEHPAMRRAIDETGIKSFRDFLGAIASQVNPNKGAPVHPAVAKMPGVPTGWAEGSIFAGGGVHAGAGISPETKVMIEGGGFFNVGAGTGGYIVFPEFMAEMIPVIRQVSVVRRLARVVPMSNILMYWPTTTTGSTWAWVAENGLKSAHDFVFSFVALQNYLMYTMVAISNQLLADSRPSAEAIIREDFARGAAETEDIAFVRGTGVAGTDPIFGIINNVLVPNVAAGAVFDYDDIIILWRTVQQALRRAPVRPGTIANANAIAQLAMVKDGIGQYVWKEPYQGMDGAIGRLPFIGAVYADENIATAAGPPITTSIIYGDWNEAVIGDREDMVIAANPWSDTAFAYNLTLFRAERRVGFQLLRPTAFVVLTGCQIVA